jgi:hypothetical protein
MYPSCLFFEGEKLAVAQTTFPLSLLRTWVGASWISWAGIPRPFCGSFSMINDTGLAALTLLVAESDPKQKEILIKLIMNLLCEH